MIAGIGVDAVLISRIRKLSETAINRIFHEKEISHLKTLKNAVSDVQDEYLASRFAVKEAYAKARGLGFGSKISPNEICTENNAEGQPYIVLYGKTLENAPKQKIHLSLTHEEPLAIAFVVLEEE